MSEFLELIRGGVFEGFATIIALWCGWLALQAYRSREDEEAKQSPPSNIVDDRPFNVRPYDERQFDQNQYNSDDIANDGG